MRRITSLALFLFLATAAVAETETKKWNDVLRDIYIDGVLKSSNLDLYAATQQWQYWLNYSGLTNANHTIEVRPTHTKNTKSKGYDVVVDSFTGPVTALP